MQKLLPITNSPTSRIYTAEEVERLVYELLAASVLDALPSGKLKALDEVLSRDDDTLEVFLEEHVPHFKEVLERAQKRLTLSSTSSP